LGEDINLGLKIVDQQKKRKTKHTLGRWVIKGNTAVTLIFP